jgi:hypothetical protein
MSLLSLFVSSAFLLGPRVPPTTPAYVYWEDLSAPQRMAVLRTPSLTREAVEYDQGRLVPTDDDRTFALLDAITAPWPDDPGVRAFYFSVLTRICAKSDGALSEALPTFAERVAAAEPAYVLTYLGRHKALLDKYALLLGGEFKSRETGRSDLPHTLAEFKSLLADRVAGHAALQPVLADGSARPWRDRRLLLPGLTGCMALGLLLPRAGRDLGRRAVEQGYLDSSVKGDHFIGCSVSDSRR